MRGWFSATSTYRNGCARSLLSGCFVGLSLVATLARAQAPAEPSEASAEPVPVQLGALSAEYEQAIDLALREHERGNFLEARAHMRRAHELAPSARTLRGLGKVEFELRNYGESVRYFEESLASSVRPLDAELRHELEGLLARASAYVGEVHLDLRPGTATVSVDGVPVARGPQASLKLAIGDHILDFHASGHLPARRTVSVRGGEQTRIQVHLSAPEAERARAEASQPALSPAERPRGGAPLYRKWWVWTAAGVVAAGVAASVIATRDRGVHERSVEQGTSGITLESK